MSRIPLLILAVVAFAEIAPGQVDPAQEPSVIAVAKTMPAVVNINTQGVVSRQVSDSMDEFYKFFNGRGRTPRVIKQQVQSLGTGFIVESTGFIVTNEHVVSR